MLLIEYRIPLPLTVEEYRLAQLYMIVKKSQLETNDLESGVEIITNEPYSNGPEDSGQYTEKVYYIGSHIPGWIKSLIPKSALTVLEKSWNRYPYTKTECTSPFVSKFSIEIESKYVNEGGMVDNIFDLNKSELKKREIVLIDIVKDKPLESDYNKDEDPLIYSSKETKRGPLTESWLKDYREDFYKVSKPKSLMCVYKLCRINFQYWGLQTKIEKYIDECALRKLLLRAHRQAWAWQDEWVNLTIDDIRAMEGVTKKMLNEKLNIDDSLGDTSLSHRSSIGTLRTARGSITNESFLDITMTIEDESDDDEFYDVKDDLETHDSLVESLTLALVVHGGSLLDKDSEGTKKTDFHTFQSAFESLVKDCFNDYLTTKFQLKLIPCPAVCYYPYTLLSSLSPVGFQSPLGTGVPVGALPLLAVSDSRYQAWVDKLVITANVEHTKFQKENPNKKINVIIIADSVGSIVSYDALSRDQKFIGERAKQVQLKFKVSHFFMLGSPIGTILAFRKNSRPNNASVSKPCCGQIYNLFYPVDIFSSRIEPIIREGFSKISPITVKKYEHWLCGNQTSLLISEYTNGGDLYEENAEYIGDNFKEKDWWGSKRIDYTLYCPEGVSNCPVQASTYLFQSSFWESKDVAAFIIRQLCQVIKQEEFPEVMPEYSMGKWIKTRTTLLLRKNFSPNHRASDILLKEDSVQTISAKFMYGPLDMMSLTGEKVEISVQRDDLKKGEWTPLANVLTDKSGRITYTLTDKQKLSNGIYPIKMVVNGDLSQTIFSMAVLPSETECVVFSLDGAFCASFSVTGIDPKIRPGAVDVVRHWKKLGYLIIYVSSRPDLQLNALTAWLGKHNFPFGLVFFADGWHKGPLRYKADLLSQIFEQANLQARAAYGSEKDVWVYQKAGIESSCMNIIGKVSKKHPTINILSEGYAAHLENLTAPGSSRPAGGNGRLVLSQSHVNTLTMKCRCTPDK